MKLLRPRTLPFLAALAATSLASAHQRTFVEPLPPREVLPGAGPSAMYRIWKLGCVEGTQDVDDATFHQALDASRALEAANLASGNLQLVPQGGTSALTNFDLSLTVSAPPPGAAAAVAVVEGVLESQLGSTHATGPVAILIQWGALPPGVAMSTGVSATEYAYPSFVSNLQTWDDADDVLPAFFPPGPTVPVRFDSTSASVTNAPTVIVPLAMLQATNPDLGTLPTPQATITVNSGVPWDYDPSNGVTAGSLCFRTAMIHELLHALAFVSDTDLGIGKPSAMDLLRFQRTTGNPPALDYMDFRTRARLVDFNSPDDDAELDLVTWEYAMADGSPHQGSHFRDETPRIGVMTPVLNFGETAYPAYVQNSDLRVLDALGFDWDDPNLDGLAQVASTATLDENPSSALQNRFRVQFTKRVGPVTPTDIVGTAFFSPTTTSIVPDPSSALSFDGSNWVDLSNFPELPTRGTLAWTVEFWYSADPTPLPMPVRTLISFGTTTLNRGIQVQLDASNNLIVAYGPGGSFVNLGPQLNNSTWHHFALRAWVGLGGGIYLFQDGALVGSIFTPLQLLGGSFYVGRSHATSATADPFRGDIDSVRVYDVSLSDTQIASRRQLALQASTTGLIADFPFDAIGNLGVGGPELETPNVAAKGAAGAELGGSGATRPTIVPGRADSASSFVVTVAHAPTSGVIFCEVNDFDTIRELRSGAPLGGPGDQGVQGSPYVLQFGAGYGFCEGTGCPCLNDAPIGTWVGCLSSIGQGGRLRATGSQSISAANLTLLGNQMPNSNALYLASNAQTSTVFGDGIFCLAGTIIRLGTKTNAGGASQFPDVGQVPIATRVSATVGATSYFQVWYRNSAVFCNSATFNDSNAWRVTWTP